MDSYNIFLNKQDSMFVIGKVILQELHNIRMEIQQEFRSIQELLTQHLSTKKLHRTSHSAHASFLPQCSVDNFQTCKPLKKLSPDVDPERRLYKSHTSPTSGNVDRIANNKNNCKNRSWNKVIVGDQSNLCQNRVLSQQSLSPNFSNSSDNDVAACVPVYQSCDEAHSFSIESSNTVISASLFCDNDDVNKKSDNLSEDQVTTKGFCQSINEDKFISANLLSKQSEEKLKKLEKYHGVLKRVEKKELNSTTHLVAKHARLKQLCRVCGKYCMYLARHMRIHTGERPHKCPQCDKRFIDKRKLSNHIRSHTGERPFSCPTCSKAFSQQENLRKHQLTHDPEGKHPCKYCGRCFPKSAALQNHILCHTGMKPFQCDNCYRSYSTRWSMLKHMQTDHSKAESPFECKCCQKRFRSHGDLTRHLLIHSGEKPFQCIQCGKSFRLQGTLKTHLKVHNKK